MVEIEDKGEVRMFEVMPTEGTLYLTAVRYNGSSFWCSGPSSMDKAEVIKMISGYTGIDKARIYAVKVPLVAVDAA